MEKVGKPNQHFLGEGTDSFENLSAHTGGAKHIRGPRCNMLSNQVQRGLNFGYKIMARENLIKLEE